MEEMAEYGLDPGRAVKENLLLVRTYLALLYSNSIPLFSLRQFAGISVIIQA
jgi:hypothetical protein